MKKNRSTLKSVLIAGVVTLATALIVHFIVLFPINIKSLETWFFFLVFLAEFAVVYTISDTYVATAQADQLTLPTASKYLLYVGVGAAIFAAVMVAYSIPLLHASNYTALIGNDLVQKDIEDYSPTLDSVPLLDKASAELLANRTMGSLVDEVSQYQLGDSVQITVSGTPIRVQPLEYAGFIKWITNRSDGIPGYISVDMNTQQSQIVRLDEGIRYSPSGYLFDNIQRYARYCYPFDMFDDYSFELDDSGNPYWIFPVLDHEIGLFGGTDVQAVVAINAVTGEHARYTLEDIPAWIDNVFSPELIMMQYDYYGSFQNGYINSIIGQKGVVCTTDGYNYIPMGDDLYMYTGVTSVLADESNIGFLFANLRTKEVEYYEYAGAEEYSAAASAEGMVQNLRYSATFPLLLKIDEEPTYVVALKDDAGLVKMYGMVNVSNYQIVATGDTVEACETKYFELMRASGVTSEDTSKQETIEGRIEEILTASLNGTTVYYIKVSGDDNYYAISLADNQNAVLLQEGDSITLQCNYMIAGAQIQEALLLDAAA